MSLMASHNPSAIPGARFMDPVVLARIGNLSLVARAVVDGFINGLHKAPYFGASVVTIIVFASSGSYSFIIPANSARAWS